jgi:oxygen-dependent protoporphyrinogen oxidase
LLRGIALGASVHLGEIRSASVATVALAYRPADLRSPSAPDGLGLAPLPGASVLVPRSEGRPITAVVASSVRWPWRAEHAGACRLAVVKVSLGRLDEEVVLQRDDAELAALAHAELAFLLRTGRAAPAASVVSRWGGALPQYAVGHVDRVAAVRESVATQPALAVCGAAYDGTGVAACIASGRDAAATVATAVRASARAAR